MSAADYRQRLCPLDDCGAALWITHTLSRPVYNADTVPDLGDPANHYTSSWSVGCTEGHVLVLPHDHAGDAMVFGICGECEDDSDPHRDLARVMAASRLGEDPS